MDAPGAFGFFGFPKCSAVGDRKSRTAKTACDRYHVFQRKRKTSTKKIKKGWDITIRFSYSRQRAINSRVIFTMLWNLLSFFEGLEGNWMSMKSAECEGCVCSWKFGRPSLEEKTLALFRKVGLARPHLPDGFWMVIMTIDIGHWLFDDCADADGDRSCLSLIHSMTKVLSVMRGEIKNRKRWWWSHSYSLVGRLKNHLNLLWSKCPEQWSTSMKGRVSGEWALLIPGISIEDDERWSFLLQIVIEFKSKNMCPTSNSPKIEIYNFFFFNWSASMRRKEWCSSIEITM